MEPKSNISQFSMFLLPAYETIPDEFKHRNTKWTALFQDWFFYGLDSLTVTMKPGIDKSAALLHISTIMKSWTPKQEHKEAGVAYLMSQWFDDATWKAKVH